MFVDLMDGFLGGFEGLYGYLQVFFFCFVFGDIDIDFDYVIDLVLFIVVDDFVVNEELVLSFRFVVQVIFMVEGDIFWRNCDVMKECVGSWLVVWVNYVCLGFLIGWKFFRFLVQYCEVGWVEIYFVCCWILFLQFCVCCFQCDFQVFLMVLEFFVVVVYFFFLDDCVLEQIEIGVMGMGV